MLDIDVTVIGLRLAGAQTSPGGAEATCRATAGAFTGRELLLAALRLPQSTVAGQLRGAAPLPVAEAIRTRGAVLVNAAGRAGLVVAPGKVVQPAGRRHALVDSTADWWTAGYLPAGVTRTVRTADPAAPVKAPMVRNLAINPAPGSAAGWGTNDAAMWTTSYAGGEVSVARSATAYVSVLSSLYVQGLSVGTPNPAVTGPHQVSVQVFATVPAVSYFSGSGFPAGLKVPANVWTTLRYSFTGAGSPGDYWTMLTLVCDGVADPGVGTFVKLRRSMLVAAPPAPLLAYADGDTPNWNWEGTPHASSSIGRAIYEGAS